MLFTCVRLRLSAHRCHPPTHPPSNHKQAVFANALESLQAQHLAATLKNLKPVNAIKLWGVKVQV